MKKIKISLAICLALSAIMCNIAAKDKVFAAFNLKIANITENPVKVRCASTTNKDMVFFYNGSTWDSLATDDFVIPPGKEIFIHGGVFCKIERWFWIRTSEYISKDSKFFALIWTEDKNNAKGNIVKIIWQGGEEDHDPEEQYTTFYYYHYTGSFIKESVSSEMKAETPGSFEVLGSGFYYSPKYRNDTILTCDVPWESEAGCYLITVAPADKVPDLAQIYLWNPKIKHNNN